MPAGVFLTTMLLNCSGVERRPDDVHGNLEGLFLIGGRRAKLAGGNFDVLLGESIDDVGGGELAGGELDRVEPDAHGILPTPKMVTSPTLSRA